METEKTIVVKPLPERKHGPQLLLADFITEFIQPGDELQYVYAGERKSSRLEKFVRLELYRMNGHSYVMVITKYWNKYSNDWMETRHFDMDASLVPRHDGSWNTNYFVVTDELQDRIDNNIRQYLDELPKYKITTIIEQI